MSAEQRAEKDGPFESPICRLEHGAAAFDPDRPIGGIGTHATSGRVCRWDGAVWRVQAWDSLHAEVQQWLFEMYALPDQRHGARGERDGWSPDEFLTEKVRARGGPPMTEQTISERIEAAASEVLAAHRPLAGTSELACACGAYRKFEDGGHRAHLAKETTAALLAAGILQEVEADGLRKAADEGPLHFAATHTGRDARGWNVVEADWLRDRADSIVQGRRDGGVG